MSAMLLQGHFRGDAYGPYVAQLYKPVQGSTAIPGPYAQQMMAQAPYVSPGHYAARAVEPGGRRSEDKEACNDPEAACDEDKFGQESKGPEQSDCWKPVLPLTLSVSTILGGVAVMMVQVPMLAELTGWPWMTFSLIALALYGVTLLCMLWVARADPGQVSMKQGEEGQGGELPKRTHKSWLYPEPIRRYDHYCKWLQNVVGLLNHRDSVGEFFMMLIGLTLIAVLGVIIDPCLAVLAYEGTIFMVHVGLISRNETAQVVHNTSKGDNVPAEDLSDSDEYNEHFDKGAFIYSNCFNFWCQPRWPAGVKGDFCFMFWVGWGSQMVLVVNFRMDNSVKSPRELKEAASPLLEQDIKKEGRPGTPATPRPCAVDGWL
ncbi:unnamed protein product [Symbiodinium natans]|uniref:Palmitoyltransferase n=1 Tax=Symbiodinium natans TaxID=878477 RepID=A0A812LV94_9DINO|nr:unnamed protein product [Symbiodinium natans]